MTRDIRPGPEWTALAERIAGTVMVVGAADVGKSALACWLADALRDRLGSAALVSTDVGQPSLGPPACLAVGLLSGVPARLWFVGDVSPAGRLLPIVIGAGRLAAWARTAGAAAVVVDTGGLVDGPLGRALKHHKALAVEVEEVVAVQHAGEIEPLLALLAAGGRRVHRVGAVAETRMRRPEERRAYRRARFEEHLGERVRRFDVRRVIDVDWRVGLPADPPPSPGTLVGLLRADGFCAALGTVEAVERGTISVRTTARAADVAWLQLGTRRLTGEGAAGP
jgi:polynucleotide 5'-hydroxyl-kinase GRC3/NOL9